MNIKHWKVRVLLGAAFRHTLSNKQKINHTERSPTENVCRLNEDEYLSHRHEQDQPIFVPVKKHFSLLVSRL